MVYKRVRGWCSGRSLPVLNFVKCPRPREQRTGTKLVITYVVLVKIRVKLFYTILSKISLIFLGIRTNFPQRARKKLNIRCSVTRPCCLWGSGNIRILQSFTTRAACSHYKSASNLQEQTQSARCHGTSGIISNGKTKGFKDVRAKIF